MSAVPLDLPTGVTRGTQTVLAVDPRNDAIWDKVLRLYDSTVFQSPPWIRAIADTYGWDPGAYVVLDGEGNPTAGVPFFRISDIVGTRISILPFSDYCDPLVGETREWETLLSRLLSEGSPVTVACLRNQIPLANCTASSVGRARWHGIDLAPDLNEIWSRFDHAAKGSIAKAQREGVRIRYAESEKDLRAFFAMHLRTRKYKYRLLAQPYGFFESVWHGMIEKGPGVLMLATLLDQVIAAGLFLEWRGVLFYKINASSPSYLSYRPNDLLIWEAIRYGKARGCRELDFGRTDWDHERLARYKLKFGAHEETISTLRYDPRGGATEQERQVRSVLPKITDLLTEDTVPDSVTERAGDILYRYFV